MIRYGSVLLLACALWASGAAQERGKEQKNFKFEGVITGKSPKDKKRDTPCQIHVVPFKAGQAYAMYLSFTEAQPFLRIENSDGEQVAESVVLDGTPNCQIFFKCTRAGDYRVICTSVRDIGNGKCNYSLTINCALSSSAHDVLLDKPAPEVAGDFAVNGKVHKLSDLKNKVVVLKFWAVQLSSCVAVVPHLNALHKTHKNDGLEVIGVTFYNSEMGNKLRFDAEDGKLKKLDVASPDTDQTMFKTFADYHKIEYPLLALRRADALKTFNDYLVNSQPQIVVIDRKGFVRFTFVGETQIKGAAVETAVKQLVDERNQRE